jgi:hypothetical protein
VRERLEAEGVTFARARAAQDARFRPEPVAVAADAAAPA